MFLNMMSRKKLANKRFLRMKRIKGDIGTGTMYVIIIILLMSFAAFTLIGGQLPQLDNSQVGQPVAIVTNAPEPAKRDLQLYTFFGATITPTPRISLTQTPPQGGWCPLDALKPAGSKCTCPDVNAIFCPVAGQQPSCPDGGVPMPFPPGSTDTWYCMTLGKPGSEVPNPPPPPPGCFAGCIAKPVIYLYPTEPTSVSVVVKAPGNVVKSEPLYPVGGWKNVTAYPDGTLWYNDQKYNELFYETAISKKIIMPNNGIIIPVDQLEKTLYDATRRLGLIQNEQKEFVEYWVPVLENLNSPYIFFSVLAPDVKDAVDHLDISPLPDTRIEIIAYFKPLQTPIYTRPLILPAVPRNRSGFTEVEWGGTIGY